MIAFAPSMFPNQIVIRKVPMSRTSQGGVNPNPAAGTPYAASVQDFKTTVVEPQGKMVGPRTITRYHVYIPRNSADTLIPSLIVGDQIEFAGMVMTIQGPARNRGGYNVLWQIEADHVR